MSLQEAVQAHHKKYFLSYYKYQEMYEEMEPIQFGDLVFKFYSYIVFPYRKYGDIVDLQDQSKK